MTAPQERMGIVRELIRQQHPRNLVLSLCGIAKSSYFYQPVLQLHAAQHKGVRANERTVLTDGSTCSNAIVVEVIRQLLMQEFADYGYLKVTCYL